LGGRRWHGHAVGRPHDTIMQSLSGPAAKAVGIIATALT